MKTQEPKVGDKISTWFSGAADGKSIIIAVSPYQGRYREIFKWDVTVTAFNEKGNLVMSV